MKILLYLIALITMLTACHQQTTEEKITSTVKELVKNGLASQNIAADSIKIFNLTYQPYSIKEYYIAAENRVNEFANHTAIPAYDNTSDSVPNMPDSSVFFKGEVSFIDSMLQKTDTTVKIFKASYQCSFINSQSKIQTFPGFSYLYQSDLQHVHINFDSLYRKQGGHN